MGAKADFIYEMANESQPKEISKDFKDALCREGKFKGLNEVDAVNAFFEKYEKKPWSREWSKDMTDEDKKSIAASGCIIVASMPTPRY